MTLGAFTLAFIAGVLSILSPCVLPIVPLGHEPLSFHRLAVSVLSAAAILNLGLYPIRAVLSGAPSAPFLPTGVEASQILESKMNFGRL
jgi:cytochrome c biogenesis protein CcdA